MSSILQGLGNRIMSQVGRTHIPKVEKEKEERPQGATSRNYDSYEPSTIATMMMSEEIVEEADIEEVVDTEMSDDVLVEEEELDVDGEDVAKWKCDAYKEELRVAELLKDLFEEKAQVQEQEQQRGQKRGEER